MKYSFYFLFCFILFFAACKENSSSTKTTTTSQQTKKVGGVSVSTYQHPAKIYSLLLPDGWKKEYIDKTQTVEVSKTKTEKVYIVQHVGPLVMGKDGEMKNQGIDIKKFAKTQIEYIVSKTLGFKMVENNNFLGTSAEKPGHLVYDYLTEEGTKLRRHSILKTDGKQLFAFHMDCKPENYSQMKEILMTMVDSFEVIKK